MTKDEDDVIEAFITAGCITDIQAKNVRRAMNMADKVSRKYKLRFMSVLLSLFSCLTFSGAFATNLNWFTAFCGSFTAVCCIIALVLAISSVD